MIPYVPETEPMRGDMQADLLGILAMASWNTPADRLRVANTILRAGFTRRIPKKVTRFQLWSYFIETVLLGVCAHTVFGHGLMFVYGALCALTAGSALTWVGGLIINAGIDKGTIK